MHRCRPRRFFSVRRPLAHTHTHTLTQPSNIQRLIYQSSCVYVYVRRKRKRNQGTHTQAHTSTHTHTSTILLEAAIHKRSSVDGKG